jgi:hypothetical protein
MIGGVGTLERTEAFLNLLNLSKWKNQNTKGVYWEMIREFVAGFLVGFFGHRTEPWIKRNFKNGWYQLTTHTVGIVIAYPVVKSCFLHLDNVEDVGTRFDLAWIVGFTGVGLGTLAGWIYDIFRHSLNDV